MVGDHNGPVIATTRLSTESASAAKAALAKRLGGPPAFSVAVAGAVAAGVVGSGSDVMMNIFQSDRRAPPPVFGLRSAGGGRRGDGSLYAPKGDGFQECFSACAPSRQRRTTAVRRGEG